MVGQRIREYLKRNGISQTELSLSAKISLPKLNLMLTGKRKMQIDEYETICTALGLPVDTFLSPKCVKTA